MLFSKEDFRVESFSELVSFLVIAPFVGFIFPFLALAWTAGFIQDVTGWLDT